MRFSEAIDQFVLDMRSQGRMTSDATERSYRSILDRHSEDIGNRDPRTVGREDCKLTLRRWPKPNTQRVGRAILVSFYDWAMEEGVRKDNPARQTRRPKKQPTTVYRLTREEATAMLAVCENWRERCAITLGVCAGLRNAELRGLQGRHFRRAGYVHVSDDIAKGGRERWVPVIAELAPVVAELARSLADDEYVLPAQRWRDPGSNRQRGDLAKRQSSSQALRTLVMDVARRAGIAAHVHPHLMRHAYGDHVARYAGMRNAQFLLGHADIGTTETYVGKPTLDELSAAVAGFGFDPNGGTHVLPPAEQPEIPVEARTGVEPVQAGSRPPAHYFTFDSEDLRRKIELYVGHFQSKGAL